MKNKLNDNIFYFCCNLWSKITTSDDFGDLNIPKELKKWNWGAFLLNWFWGLFNKSYWSLLALIPYFGVIGAFICGLKGNEWAWKNKKWESIEQFHSVQREWALYGAIFYGIFLGIPLSIFVLDTILKGK